VRDQLNAKTFAATWAEGNAMSANQAIDYALELLAEPHAARPVDRQNARSNAAKGSA
jgi:hypothetical protein